ncbi:hypothetical protein [Flavobacterium muglaense]|uniref:Uncharacterized protein n=1 Tax=Flavobacterium muglaense TaxID=2764716 RepID=A0A923SG91_9FLAO|nr:hypothetical protein [Flavobacterium muglaense]MBC5838962.1 hypothetical protein [Flavobacterium muglaense]MBC5845487.1 hypothetical protein [Flavobacterium muglaense]
MERMTKLEGDIEKINKFTGFQLPNKFKKVGLVLIIVSILAIVSSVKLYFTDLRSQDLFERIAKTGMILGLLMISISKEKVEDELISKIRMQSFNYAVISAVLIYSLVPFIHYIFILSFSKVATIEGSKDTAILSFLLFLQILIFKKLKKAYNEE